MDPEQKRKALEVEILKIIEEKLTKGQMDISRAKLIARMLLEKLTPPLSLEQLYKIVPTLDDQFAELTIAVLPLMQENEKQMKDIVLTHAQKLIQQGKLAEATTTIQQATNKQ